MDFVKVLRSLEELLYEVMTWLVFYPRTMWLAVRHPIRMLRYSNSEMKDSPEQQFTDTLSPPLFLMITILLSHMVEVAAHQHLETATTSIGKQIIASEENLLILRSILFALYPLMFAVRRLRRQGEKLNRESLRAPFFAQCYVAAPSAFVIGIGTIMARAQSIQVQLAGLAVALTSAIWYLWVEARWLRIQTRATRFRAARSVIGTWLAASVLNSLISVAVLGI